MSIGQILTLPMMIVGIIFLKIEKSTKIYNTFKNAGVLSSLSRFIFLCLKSMKKIMDYYQKNRIGTDLHNISSRTNMSAFGECVSIFIASINERFGKIRDFCELGPGNGTLIKDLSKNLNKLIKEELKFFFSKNQIVYKNIKKILKT